MSITQKQHNRVVKNAFWQVLINCPQDAPDYKLSRRKIVQLMSVYFIHEHRLGEDVFKEFVDYIDHICEKSYTRRFKDCPDEIMDDILYLGFQKYLTIDELRIFYNYIITEKPKAWCEKCRRYSIDTEC
jgi:hypothetical protein